MTNPSTVHLHAVIGAKNRWQQLRAKVRGGGSLQLALTLRSQNGSEVCVKFLLEMGCSYCGGVIIKMRALVHCFERDVTENNAR